MCCQFVQYHLLGNRPKEWWRLWCATLGAAFGAGFLIYSTYVTNNLQVVGEEFLNTSYIDLYGTIPDERKITYLWATVIAAKEVGKIVGTLLIPVIAERYGRRSGMMLNCLVTIIGCILCYMTTYWSYATILVGRFLLGVSMILGVSLASLFLIEVAPMEIRGSTGALIQIFRGFGGMLGMTLTLPNILGNARWWTVALALPALPAVWQLIILSISMESPRHLFITSNEPARAAEAVQFYQGDDHVSTTMKDLQKEKYRITQQSKIPFSSLVKTRSFWKPLLLTTLALSNRALAGILPVQSYSTDMFRSAGMEHETSTYCTAGLGLCHFISAIVVTCTVEKYGRRTLLLWANTGCMLALLLVSLFSFASINGYAPARVLTVLSLMLFMLIYPVVASVSNIVASEICHQRFRSYAFTIGLLFYSIVSLLSTFAYPFIKHSFGLPSSFVPFCFLILVTILLYWYWLPETRGKTFESLAFESSPRRYQPIDNSSALEPLLDDDQEHILFSSNSNSIGEYSKLEENGFTTFDSSNINNHRFEFDDEDDMYDNDVDVDKSGMESPDSGVDHI